MPRRTKRQAREGRAAGGQRRPYRYTERTLLESVSEHHSRGPNVTTEPSSEGKETEPAAGAAGTVEGNSDSVFFFRLHTGKPTTRGPDRTRRRSFSHELVGDRFFVGLRQRRAYHRRDRDFAG